MLNDSGHIIMVHSNINDGSKPVSNGNEHETATQPPEAAIDYVGARFDRVEMIAATIRQLLEEARTLLIEARQSLEHRQPVPPAAPPAVPDVPA
jgi:hypothetical protein